MSDLRPGGLALIGYRGTGKTTVGRLLAQRLDWPFVDADQEVERRAGRTIAAIFATDGETVFRDHEEAVLRGLANHPSIVLATGGGVVLREANRRALRRFGLVAWLTAPATVLADRLRAAPEGRPALTSLGLLDEIALVLTEREALYREVADAILDTTRLTPSEVADAILARWHEPGGAR